MGSFFAGIKAGTLAGLLYLGGLALFNILLLYALKADVFSVFSQTPSLRCTPVATANTSSFEKCLSDVVTYYVPFIAFLGFSVTLFLSGVFGRYYDSLPGKGPILKGELVAAVVGISFVLSPFWLPFNLVGFYFDFISGLLVSIFLLFWTITFGFAVGKLYKRYTRLVTLASQDPGSLKVFVDGRDLTGKTRTLATKSIHEVRAEVASDSSFREWTFSGGVTVEDPRSFETAMEVNGDGLLKAMGGKKY